MFGALSAVFVLVGCGGGASFTSTTPDPGNGGGGGGSQPVKTLRLVASSPDLPVDATATDQGVQLTAIALDANNNTVPNVAVQFSTNKGVLTVQSSTTNTAGTASAVLTSDGTLTAGSPITVTVSANGGSMHDTQTINVVAPQASVFRLGSFIEDSFVPGVIAINGANPFDFTPQLQAGASADLRVDIVDQAQGNAPVTDAVTVTFTSPCVAQNRATVTSPVTAVAGAAFSTYQAKGCTGNDPITAIATVSGKTLKATGVIKLLTAQAASIAFISATPTTIGLKGTGLHETSAVVFQVLNTAGGPVAGQPVKLALDNTGGGITLTPNTSTPSSADEILLTDSSGRVQITVNSGTLHTSVSVTATVVDTNGNPVPGITPAKSLSLAISTATADQNSTSLAIGCVNIEGHNIDGNTTPVVIHAADRFNNPVPDGTTVTFTTEGGSVGPACPTLNGTCSVPFVTQNPRNFNHRYTVLAYTTPGEESFTDLNGNGVFDDGEPFGDLGEAFRDDDESHARSPGEVTFDFNNDGIFNPPNGKFTGLLCKGPTLCDTVTSLHARDDEVIVMSSSDAIVQIVPGIVELSGGSAGVDIIVGDTADQPMAGGSTILAEVLNSADTGIVIDGKPSESFVQACSNINSPFHYPVTISQKPTGSGPPDTLKITVTTPSGIKTSYSFPIVRKVVVPPPPGNLQTIAFVSAEPTTIGLKGTGLNESSTVKFQVLGDNGSPLSGRDVKLTLDTTVGGITISAPPGPAGTSACATSDAGGFVTAFVQSGSIHTSVRVLATVANSSNGTCTGTAIINGQPVSTVSSRLTITTGIPDQDSLSVFVSAFNPSVRLGGSAVCDNVPVQVNVLAADRFNNPVPDGTAFAFTTEGGSIDGTCASLNGGCSVTWRSQNPYPADGRSTILVTALGEESFTDLNGDGHFDDPEPFTDLPEAFVDLNENGVHEANEPFLDLNLNGQYDGPSGSFTGVLCDGPTKCDTVRSTLHVRDQVVLTMSSQKPVVTPQFPVPFVTQNDSTSVLSFVIKGDNGQPLPVGTTVSLEVPSGVTVDGNSSFTVGSFNDASNGANTYNFIIVTANDKFVNGFIKVKVNAPSICGARETIVALGFKSLTQCSDGVNNDASIPNRHNVDSAHPGGNFIDEGDSFVDADDAGCHDITTGDYNPNRDSELSQCQDGVNNDAVEGTDAEDPDCHFLSGSTIGDFNPQINNEAAATAKRLLVSPPKRTLLKPD